MNSHLLKNSKSNLKCEWNKSIENIRKDVINVHPKSIKLKCPRLSWIF